MDFVEAVNAAGSWLQTFLLNEWTLYQSALIAVGYLLSGFLAKRIEPAVESRARTIKGNPDLLRVIIAFMRRLRWLFLIVWLAIADVVLLQFAWPSHRWLVATTLTLVVAWFVISVLTRIIRNQMLEFCRKPCGNGDWNMKGSSSDGKIPCSKAAILTVR